MRRASSATAVASRKTRSVPAPLLTKRTYRIQCVHSQATADCERVGVVLASRMPQPRLAAGTASGQYGPQGGPSRSWRATARVLRRHRTRGKALAARRPRLIVDAPPPGRTARTRKRAGAVEYHDDQERIAPSGLVMSDDVAQKIVRLYSLPQAIEAVRASSY